MAKIKREGLFLPFYHFFRLCYFPLSLERPRIIEKMIKARIIAPTTMRAISPASIPQVEPSVVVGVEFVEVVVAAGVVTVVVAGTVVGVVVGGGPNFNNVPPAPAAYILLAESPQTEVSAVVVPLEMVVQAVPL